MVIRKKPGLLNDLGFFLSLGLLFLTQLSNRCLVFSGSPRLLVSVRDANEALMAVRGGADLVDVKEPDHGSLGRASIEDLRAIADVLKIHQQRTGRGRIDTVLLSIALGEVHEWSESSGINFVQQLKASSCQTSDALCEAISDLQPGYMKLGLSQVIPAGVTGAGHWWNSWIDVRCRFSGDHRWVAVAYADYQRAHAPVPEDVLAAALETNCSVLLIDTFVKDGTTLLDWMSVQEIASLRKATSAHGLQFAVAGRVTLLELPSLLPMQPDIIAVRGAVCERGERTAAISERLVAEFLERVKY